MHKESTGAVTLTIGGNDVYFAKILESCTSIGGIVSVTHVLNHLIGGFDCPQWIAAANALIPTMKVLLSDAYRKILANLPVAGHLLVGTYPNIFPASYTGGSDLGGNFCIAGGVGINVGYTHADVVSFRSLEDGMNQAIRDAVTDAQTKWGDTRIRLVDLAADPSTTDHTSTCGDSGRPTPYVNGLLFAIGDFATCIALPWCRTNPLALAWSLRDSISKASFHPRTAGHDAFAPLFNAETTHVVPVSVLRPTVPRLIVGADTTFTLGAVGGNPSAWAVTAGALPPGMTLDSATGTIAGTPTATGNYSVTITATVGGKTASRTFTMPVGTIAPCTIVWNDPTFNSGWTDPTSWFPNRVPAATDVICINGDGQNRTLYIGQPVTAKALRISGMLDVTIAGDLTITSTTPASILDQLSFAGTTLTGPTSGPLPLTNVRWENGQLHGTFAVPTGGTLTTTGSNLALDGTITNLGTTNLAGTLYLTTSARIDNQATLTADDGAIHADNGTGQQLHNGTNGRIHLRGGSLTIDIPFQNDGYVDLDENTNLDIQRGISRGTIGGQGTLTLQGTITNLDLTPLANLAVNGKLQATDLTLAAYTTLSGSLVGSFTVPAAATFTPRSGSTVDGSLTNNGTVLFDSSSGYLTLRHSTVFTNNGAINVGANVGEGIVLYGDGPATMINNASGTVSLGTKSSLYINTPLTNNGTFLLGTGSLSITGSYRPARTAVLAVTVSPTSCGHLSVGGASQLRGRLAITTASGYTPPIGTTVSVLSAQDVTGTFSKVTGTQLSTEHWGIGYTAVAVTLTATAD